MRYSFAHDDVAVTSLSATIGKKPSRSCVTECLCLQTLHVIWITSIQWL